jgi:taurine dioxygenase
MPVGAEIIDLPPGAEERVAVRAALYEAWLQHGILLFHNVGSIDRHLTLSRIFGDLEIHPFPPARSEEHELLIDIGGKKRPPAFVYDGTNLRVNRIPWHRDTAYTPDICKGSMLRMVEAPAEEGETLLCDTAMAYDDLPEAMKQRLDTLEFQATLRLGPVEQTGPGSPWRAARPATAEEDPAGGHKRTHDTSIIANYPPVIHPAVLRHPESGRKCIFISPTYVDHFIGLDQAESDRLLRDLCSHMFQPKYVYRHRWAANDAILWDNRRFLHAGLGNKIDDRRWGLRTTLAGPLRTGRYVDENAEGAAPDFAD